MTEQEYAAIAAAGDRLLCAQDTSLARLAIPPLHVINEHPGCTSVYDPAARRLADWEDFPRAALRAARAVVRSARRGREASGTRAPIDVLIISHLVNPTQLEQTDDLYFGPLQQLLTDNGATSLLAFVNHLRFEPQGSSILPKHAPPAVEAQLWLQSFKERNALRALARATHDPIALLASRHAWLEPTVANLRLHRSIAELCQAHSPKIVLTTYEGEACERIIWHAARSNGAKPLCVGYQHARVLPRAHAIRRSLGLDCDPDVVLTSAQSSHAALAGSPGLAAVKFIRYGSHRTAPAAQRPSSHKREICLVLPDAAPAECALLLEFASACAKQLPAVTFELRPHPATEVRAMPANVMLSTGGASLAEACSEASWCLYRGSSAVVQAVMAGVRPFYLQQPDEMSFDPLAGLSGWREMVASPEDFVARRQIPGKPGEWQAAVDFCQQHTSLLEPAAVTQLLNMVRNA